MDFSDILIRYEDKDCGFAKHQLLLYSLVIGLNAKNVFEFGSGDSTLTILQALDKTDGKLISCDVPGGRGPVKLDKFAKKNPDWDRSRLNYVLKNSKLIEEILRDHAQGIAFDLVLHDGSHTGRIVLHDLQVIVSKMKRNGILIVHDTAHKRPDFGLLKQCKKAMEPYSHSMTTLPYGCGLTIIRMESDLGNGKVKF